MDGYGGLFWLLLLLLGRADDISHIRIVIELRLKVLSYSLPHSLRPHWFIRRLFRFHLITLNQLFRYL